MARPRKQKIITLDQVSDFDSQDFDPGLWLAEHTDLGIAPSAQTQVLRDERLDVPRAANFMEFCASPNYLKFPAFPRMLQIASHLLGEICYFCSDNDFMYQMYDQDIGEITDRIVFTRYSRCPKCQRTRFDFIKNRRWAFPEALIAVLGQRSGKNYLLGQLSCYQLHRYLTLEIDGERVSPHKYLRLGPGMLTMTFTAATLGQAMRNIWNVLQPMIQSSPWFQEYFKYLRYHGKKIGEELLVDNATFLRFRNKLIDVACQAPDQRTLRGPTRIGFGMDEICWHDAKVEETSGKGGGVLGSVEDIWTSLHNSLRTVRNASFELMKAGDFDAPQAYDWSISSPCHSNDIGMRRLRMADPEVNPRIYGAHYATWEVNPEFKDGKKAFATDYIQDEVKADRDFGAIPPLTISPWIQDPKPLLQSVRAKQDQPIITYEFRSERSVFGNMSAWLELKDIRDSSTPRILSIDNGYNNNAFALTLSSLDSAGKPYIDQCCLLKPTDAYNINLSKMWDNFIYPIITKLNCILILYDRWNSLQNVQKLQDEGKDARQYSLTPKDFMFFRLKLLNSEVSYPFSEYTPNVFLDSSNNDVDLVGVSTSKPGFALLLQTLTVRQIGGRVHKPLHGDDDVFRTAMLGLKFLYDPDIMPKLRYTGPGKQSQVVRDIRSMGSIRHMSQSSGSITTSGAQGTQRPNDRPRALMSVKTKSSGR